MAELKLGAIEDDKPIKVTQRCDRPPESPDLCPKFSRRRPGSRSAMPPDCAYVERFMAADRSLPSLKGITRQTEPAREPFLAIMPNTAKSGLSAMQAQPLSIPREMLPKFKTLVCNSAQILDTDPVRASREEHDRLMDRKRPSDRKGCADSSPTSDYCCFKDAARRNDPHRDEA